MQLLAAFEQTQGFWAFTITGTHDPDIQTNFTTTIQPEPTAMSVQTTVASFVANSQRAYHEGKVWLPSFIMWSLMLLTTEYVCYPCLYSRYGAEITSTNAQVRHEGFDTT